jgi:glyoxylase-like metal-dependent hydrolase (beta-lactamase superfamily II)/rhodanese-related sulfurtransferase
VLYFRQYYLGCLSHASYVVGDTESGRAVVVDPQRDVTQYVADAAAAGLRIERVIETHFHADFLSGHLELAEATGAVISYGAAADGRVEFPIDPLADGTRLSLGSTAGEGVEVEVLATPGHTPESISLVVRERAGDAIPYGVLTGDTLFIGDVGRPDLLSSDGVPADDLARQLYRSLHDQLLTLPDATRVFPAHGAGSACGKHLSSETESTIGAERRTNYALQPMSEDAFVAAVTDGQPAAPLYFAFAADRNRRERATLHESDPVPVLDLDALLRAQADGAAVVDSRDPADFAAGHLRGSINVGLGGRFAEYAGEVIRAGTPLVLVTEPGHEQEARVRLGRIGFDTVLGALDQPLVAFATRPEVVEQSSRLAVDDLIERTKAIPGLQIVDVRGAGEVEADGMLPGARHVPLAQLLDRMDELDPALPVVVTCASGYRSSIAASVLRAHGFEDVSDLLGGFGACRVAGMEVEQPTGTAG